MPDTIDADALTDLTAARDRYERAIVALNFDAALVAWSRITVLLDRTLNAWTRHASQQW